MFEHSVTIVMSVFKEPAHVEKTIESVLAQKGVNFEFIIVSDGSDASVLKLLRSYSHEPRLKLIEQTNQGLTQALINGCRIASHPYIARIDAGDEMTSGRLEKQAQILADQAEVGIVTSWVSVRTEESYPLYEANYSTAELSEGLTATNADEFKSPFHASVMFRKSVYDKVGGYRPEFYYTQDCDLWSRMIEHSTIEVIQEVLTLGLFSERGISGDHARAQKKLVSLVAKGNLMRRQGESDQEVLPMVAAVIHNDKRSVEASGENTHFNGSYFIARVLMKNRSHHAVEYWQRALRARPWSVRALIFWLVCRLRA